MTVSLKFDKVTGDLELDENGNFIIIDDKEEVTLHQLTLRFNINRGTWFRNLNIGLPLLKNANNPIQILGVVSKSVFDSYIISEASKCEFATGISSYNSVVSSDRNIEVDITVNTEFGKVTLPSVPITL